MNLVKRSNLIDWRICQRTILDQSPYILKLERAAAEMTNMFTRVSLFGVPLGLISSNNLAVFVFMNKTKIFNWEKEHTYHPKLLLNK